MSVAAWFGVLVFFLGVMASIALHEVGHLLPAKRFGVRVTQYMVGFGPTVWSRQRGETEYGFKAIPLGGYIRMVGMFPPRRNREGELVYAASSTGPFQSMIEDARRSSVQEIADGEEHRAFYQLPVRKKLVIMLGGPTMNLVLAVLLFAMALSVVGVPQLTTKVSAVAECVQTSLDVECTLDDPQAPAAAAGIQEGDVIVALDGQEPQSWDQLVEWVRARPGDQVELTIERGDEVVVVPVTVATAKVPDLDDDTKTVTAGYLGLSPSIEQVRQPITSVPGEVWSFAVLSGRAVLSIPSKMVDVWQAAFSGEDRAVDGPVSLVGVGRFSAEVAEDEASLRWKAGSMLAILASLNMALFLFNLIPLLPLDGGHVAGALYEGGRRKWASWRHRPDPGPVDVARMLPVAYTVAILLIGMSGLLIYADIVKPIRLGG
jgi:membrane-associated protease RseP (regulator of RpoE activity)